MIQQIKYQTFISQIPLILFGTILFLFPALWNGFPFIFTDTLSYITSGIELTAPFDRPLFYGLFIRTASIINKIWGEVICQSVLLTVLLLRFANTLLPRLSNGYLYLWLLLVVLLTPAPWYTGQISPDIFTPILFLALIILALTYKESTISNTIFIGSFLCLSVCVHSSNLLIGAITAGSIIFWFIVKRSAWKLWKKFLIIVCVAFISGILFIISSNIWSNYGATLNPTGKVFILARILEDGPGLKYLRDICKEPELKTCASLPLLEKARKVEVDDPESKSPELRNLVASSFLWGGGLTASGGIFSVNREAGSIIKGAIKTYPSEQFGALIRNMGYQLKVFSVENQFNSTLKIEAMNQFFNTHYSDFYGDYLNSLQSLGKIGALTHLLNPIYFYVVIFSIISLLGSYFLFLQGFISPEKISLTLFSLCFFIGANALITGGLSGIFDRYQSRVIWLLPAVSILLLLGLLKRSKSVITEG